jgi:ComF family protein
MSVIETIVRLFAPHICLSCGLEEDRLLCEDCAHLVLRLPSRCYRCRAATQDYRVCDDCAPSTPLEQVFVRTPYRDPAKELMHRMKYERARAGVNDVAKLMTTLLSLLPEDGLLTHVPTATARVRQRGYDHAWLLTRALAHYSKLEHATVLARVGQAHQVGSGRAERIRQLRGAFRPIHEASIRGRQIVLVDDVLTTGATLETAAQTLRKAGASRVCAIVFAQA